MSQFVWRTRKSKQLIRAEGRKKRNKSKRNEKGEHLRTNGIVCECVCVARNKHVSSIENINNNSNRRLMITVRAATGIWWGVVKTVFHHSNWIWQTGLTNFDQFAFFSWAAALPCVCKHLWLYYVRYWRRPPAAVISDWEQGVFDWKRKHKQYQLMTIQMTLFSFFFFLFFPLAAGESVQVDDWVL